MGICVVCGQQTEFANSEYCKQCFRQYNPGYYNQKERAMEIEPHGYAHADPTKVMKARKPSHWEKVKHLKKVGLTGRIEEKVRK